MCLGGNHSADHGIARRHDAQLHFGRAVFVDDNSFKRRR